MKFVKGSGPAIHYALEQGRKILKKTKIGQSALESELMLSAAIQKPREFIYTHPEYELSRSEERNFANFIKRRAKRIPLAYISGSKEFYGLDFFVNKNVLIPRPETEGLIDLALEKIKNNQNKGIGNIDIVDVGTGSGAIIISLAKTILSADYSPSKIFQKNLGGQATNYSLPPTNFYGLDSSKRAITIAQENAKRLGAPNIQFLRGHLLRPYFNQSKNCQLPTANYSLILANLPYLTAYEMKNLQPEVQHEPHRALDGGKDGLDVYRDFFKQLAKFQNSSFAAICEIAPKQKGMLSKIIKASLPQSEIKFSKDFSSRTRFAKIKNAPR